MSAHLLNVDKSLRGRCWLLRQPDIEAVEALRRQYALDELTARLLTGRSVKSDTVPTFFEALLKTSMSDPSTMQDMDAAVLHIMDAVAQGQNVTIFADYDVDGATSAAQLIRWARQLGQDWDVYVPDRVNEGYGPSIAAFEALKTSGTELVITVDCGAAAYDALQSAHDMGLSVIVVDHHLMEGAKKPPCLALINPNRPDDSSGLGYLAAAGVTFHLIAALNREARRRGYQNLPDIRTLLGLTALGTICDVVPLTGVNRAIVRQGLKVLGQDTILGISALCDVANVSAPLTSYHAGYVLGPRINAGGRIGQSDMGARLLTTEDSETAHMCAAELDRVNEERKILQDDILCEAETLALQKYASGHDNIIIVAMKDWHAGIIGIVAGRLKDRFDLPVIVIGIDGDIGKGSGRSIAGVNLGDAIALARKQGLLISGGGHAMAGGLSIMADNIDAFQAFMEDKLRDDIYAARQKQGLKVDALIHPSAANGELVQLIERVGPYGAGHPEPVFAMADMRITYAERVRGGHVRCRFESLDGTPIGGICFRADEMGLSAMLLDPNAPRVHVAGRVKADRWQGRERIDFQLLDIAIAHR